MGVIQRETTIKAGNQTIFNYLADVTNHSQWGAHDLKVEPKSQGPVAVGSTFETVGHQFGEQPATVTITELVPNEKIGYESTGKVGQFRHGFVIKDNGDGTSLVTKTMEIGQVNPLPFKIMMPIVRAFIAPRGLDGDLQRIKEKLEAQ